MTEAANAVGGPSPMIPPPHTSLCAAATSLTLMDALPTPCKENDWLGFCPAAVKLQSGDRKTSLKKRTDYHDSFSAAGVTTYRCAEKGCLFGGHVSVDFVWKVVMKDEKLGLQCRWLFLGMRPSPGAHQAERKGAMAC